MSHRTRPSLGRPAWIDESSGYPLDFCGSKCAVKAGVGGFEGHSQCSLPGCVGRSMADPSTGQDLGYCCEEHRLRATQRHLVSTVHCSVSCSGILYFSSFLFSLFVRPVDRYFSLTPSFFLSFTFYESFFSSTSFGLVSFRCCVAHTGRMCVD